MPFAFIHTYMNQGGYNKSKSILYDFYSPILFIGASWWYPTFANPKLLKKVDFRIKYYPRQKLKLDILTDYNNVKEKHI